MEMRMTKSPTETARKRAARSLARARWANTTPEQRSEFAAEVASARTPEQMGAAKRSDKPRCPCGLMTLKRAQARRHKCVAPEPVKPAARRRK